MYHKNYDKGTENFLQLVILRRLDVSYSIIICQSTVVMIQISLRFSKKFEQKATDSGVSRMDMSQYFSFFISLLINVHRIMQYSLSAREQLKMMKAN